MLRGGLQVYSAVLNALERHPQTPKVVSLVLANRSWCRRHTGDLKGACQVSASPSRASAVALDPHTAPRVSLSALSTFELTRHHDAVIATGIKGAVLRARASRDRVSGW